MTSESPLRAWHKTEKEMFEVEARDWRHKTVCSDLECFHESQVVILMPTGLKDKNGKEGYDHDLPRHPSYGVGEILKGYVEVEGEKVPCWVVRFLLENEAYMDMPLSEGIMRESEIVGTKFENPDLLKP